MSRFRETVLMAHKYSPIESGYWKFWLPVWYGLGGIAYLVGAIILWITQ